MRKTGYKPNWGLRIAALLLCLTMVSIHLMSGMYARYSTAVSDSDGARVAKFCVTANHNIQQMCLDLGHLQPGSVKAYRFTVSNGSEVAVQNRITLSGTQNLPLTFRLNGTDIDIDGSFTDAGLAPGTDGSYTLTVSWDAEQTDAEYAGEIDALWLTVTSEQID